MRFAIHCRGWNFLASEAGLWAVDGIRPDRYDLLGGGLMLCGVAAILIGHWSKAAA